MPGLTAEQHEVRAKGVGGSDLPCLLGLTKKTPVQLWLEKRGESKPVNLDNVASVRAGHKLEAVVAEYFEEDTGHKLRLDNKPRQHKKYPFIVGNIDRKVQGMRAGFEAKAWSGFSADQWGTTGTDEVPLGVTAQCAHYMCLHDYDLYFPAVLLGGSDFRWFELARNEDVENTIITVEAKFWQHVLDGTPPPIVDGDDVARIYKRSEGWTRPTPELVAAVREIRTLNIELAELEAAKKKLVDAVKTYLGPVGELMPPEGQGTMPLITWRTSKDGVKTDWKAAFNDLAASMGDEWFWLLAMVSAAKSEPRPGSRSFLVKNKSIDALPAPEPEKTLGDYADLAAENT